MGLVLDESDAMRNFDLNDIMSDDDYEKLPEDVKRKHREDMKRVGQNIIETTPILLRAMEDENTL